MGAGKMPALQMNALWSLVRDQLRTRLLTSRYRHWLLQKRS
jgi:hypothetical protein